MLIKHIYSTHRDCSKMEETEFEKWHMKEGIEYWIVAAIEAGKSLCSTM